MFDIGRVDEVEEENDDEIVNDEQRKSSRGQPDRYEQFTVRYMREVSRYKLVYYRIFENGINSEYIWLHIS